MRRWIGSALASALATLVLPGAAGAGRDLTPSGTVQVITFPGGGYAIGSLSATRNDSASSGYIGCSLDVDADGNVNGGCVADDGPNPAVSCRFPSLDFQPFVEAFRNMTPSSYLFIAWDGTGTCSLLMVDEDSSYAPPDVTP